MAAPSIGLPPLAGILSHEDAARPGLGVEETVARLRRYNYVETRLVELAAAFMNPTPEWEVKCALSLHLHLDAEHSAAIRERVSELRLPPLLLDRPPDPKLAVALDEALCARSTVELIAGVYGVLRPALLAAYRNHLAHAHPLFDFATCRLLRSAIADEEEAVRWAEQALAALSVDAEAAAEAAAWMAHVGAYLSAAGGICSTDPAVVDAPVPAARAVAPFEPDLTPKRDWRSGSVHNFNYRASPVWRDTGAPADERLLALMFKRLHEMDVPEVMAGLILENRDMPWEYTREVARQLWDEARHAMMGEVWMASKEIDWSRYDNHVGWSLYLNKDRAALERHIVLYAIEQGLMDGETGKRAEWTAAVSSGDALAAFMQDFDWADEVLHAQIGRRWLKSQVGDVKTILALGDSLRQAPKPTLEARAAQTPQVDWWPRFVKDVLGRDECSAAGLATDELRADSALDSG